MKKEQGRETRRTTKNRGKTKKEKEKRKKGKSKGKTARVSGWHYVDYLGLNAGEAS